MTCNKENSDKFQFFQLSFKVRKFSLVRNFKKMFAFILFTRKRLIFCWAAELADFRWRRVVIIGAEKLITKNSILFLLSFQPMFLNRKAKRKCGNVTVYFSSLLSSKTDRSLSHNRTIRGVWRQEEMSLSSF